MKLTEDQIEALVAALDRVTYKTDVRECLRGIDLPGPHEEPDMLEVHAMVRVDRTGHGLTYAIAGWSDPTPGDLHDVAMREQVDEFAFNNNYWSEMPRWSRIRARVPVPPPEVTVDAEVEP